MKAESSSTPWKYITATQLIAEVKQGLRKYDENNLIRDEDLMKHIVRCSEFLGERLHQSKQCRITVLDYKSPIPQDLWKIENMYGLAVNPNARNLFSGMFGGGLIFHNEDEVVIPSPEERIRYMGIIPNDCCHPMHVSAYDTNYFERVEDKRIFPLKLSNTLSNKCSGYAACNQWNGDYSIELQDGEFQFSFKEGEIFLSYLGDLVNDEGELLIPDHELVLPFYEWTLKKEILEDLIFNTELPVSDRYQLAQRNLVEAKIQAMDYINRFKAGQLDHLSKKRKMEFYNNWIKKFD